MQTIKKNNKNIISKGKSVVDQEVLIELIHNVGVKGVIYFKILRIRPLISSHLRENLLDEGEKHGCEEF